VKLESWIRKIILKFKPSGEGFKNFSLVELVTVLKSSVFKELGLMNVPPSSKALKDITKKIVVDASKLSNSPMGRKLIQKEMIKNEELLLSQLDYSDEVNDLKKKTYFTPLLEKALRSTK